MEPSDLERTVDVLTGLGFRVDTVIAADDAAAVVMSGHGITLHLTREVLPAHEESALLDAPLVPSLSVTRNDAGAWKVGRAGMHYRDLVPDRQGGRFIASHIRIPDGGPVADYVHFHAIRFQMIFCKRGWVRLVYEDQGEPFVMHEGQCVLQPPEIRHRVLEASPGLEVIEIGAPAVHATHADHEMSLPTGQIRPDRDFHGQRFTFGDPSSIEAATGGLARARLHHDAGEEATRSHDGALFLGVVLQGAMSLAAGGTVHRLTEADAFTIPAGAAFTLSEASADLSWLEVKVRAS